MAEHMNFDQQFNDALALAIQVKETLELVQMFVNTFQATGDDDYIDTAITLATDLPTINGPLVAARDKLILNLTNMKAHRNGPSSQILGSRSAVTAEGIGEGVNTPMAAYQLSRLYTRRYDECGGSEELAKAMEQTEEALGENSAGDPNRRDMLQTMGRLAHDRFERLGFVKDLERSIQCHEEALAVTPADHPDRVNILINLVCELGSRYRRLGVLQDVEDAIQRADEALAADHPNCAGILINLSCCLTYRYQRLGFVKDLERSIQCNEEALAVTPAGHLDRATILANLGSNIGSRFERLGTLQDLEGAIHQTSEALAADPADHPTRAGILVNLDAHLSNRYQRLGTLQDLEGAIQRAGEALAATPADHPVRVSILANLGTDLSYRYMRLGTLQDLEDAIQRTGEALAATPADHPTRVGILGNLGAYLSFRFERLGTLQDLEDAIQRTGEALAATPADHPTRAGILVNLGAHLSNRYQRLGTLQDLEGAIHQTSEALAATPADHPNCAGILINLSRCLTYRYQRLGLVKDLERSIQCNEEALAATPADHPNRVNRLSNLSANLATRGTQLGTLQDLEDAIQRADESLAATPADHPTRVTKLHNLSKSFYSRYEQLKNVPNLWTSARWSSIGHEHSGTLKGLEKAVTLVEEAVAMTPANHPSQGELLATLGKFVVEKYLNTGNKQDCLYALGVNQDVWSCSLSAPTTRIKAARSAATILFCLGRWQESSSLLEDAVKLLPTVSPRFLGRNDQEHQLSTLSDIAAEAISAALAAGKQASHCLTFLELGRGIINGLIMDCRSDISELKSKNPDMFERFDHLRIEIDSRSAYDETTYEQVSKRRMEAAEELEETLVNIRLLPCFSGFLSPPNPTDLMAAAEEGSIIIVNCTCYRSDAILVSKSVIKSLPLPLLLYNEASTRMTSLRRTMIRGLNSTYRARNRALNQFLLWLWDAAVGPIFQELQLNPVAADITPPRIWWIGVGPLSMAPFHAAGNHSEGSTDNTISRAISSYISTIKALSFAREKSLELLSRTDSKVLLVAMPGTPGESPLGSASAEVSDIAGEIEKSTNATVLEHPSASEVLEKLQSCEAVHFACHGITDARNPSNSHLLLFKDNGSAAATADPLTVEKMSSARIKTAQIAYLSACSTVDNVSEKLADESIHIASGFQLAGFSHVLGTMWKSNDVACRDVAVAFYRSLLDGQGDKGHGKVSFSFHQAVKELRQKRLRQPIIWTSFIHTGA